MAGEETDEQPMTEYERQRLSRIRENEARLEALGLRGIAASPLLRNPSPAAAKGKQKKRSADEDEEYVPSEDSGGEEEKESSSGIGQDDEVDEGTSASRSRAKGKKKKLSKSGKSTKSTPTEGSASFADLVGDDAALQQAIALSLAESSEKPVTAIGAETSSTVTGASEGTPHKNNGKASVGASAKNRKIKKLGKNRIQLTEDDVVAFFFSFDEVGKGYITPWDVERMATINDFIWTDFEISKMIRCFDRDGDGKLAPAWRKRWSPRKLRHVLRKYVPPPGFACALCLLELRSRPPLKSFAWSLHLGASLERLASGTCNLRPRS